jgi:hypothetical protein
MTAGLLRLQGSVRPPAGVRAPAGAVPESDDAASCRSTIGRRSECAVSARRMSTRTGGRRPLSTAPRLTCADTAGHHSLSALSAVWGSRGRRFKSCRPDGEKGGTSHHEVPPFFTSDLRRRADCRSRRSLVVDLQMIMACQHMLTKWSKLEQRVSGREMGQRLLQTSGPVDARSGPLGAVARRPDRPRDGDAGIRTHARQGVTMTRSTRTHPTKNGRG